MPIEKEAHKRASCIENWILVTNWGRATTSYLVEYLRQETNSVYKHRNLPFHVLFLVKHQGSHTINNQDSTAHKKEQAASHGPVTAVKMSGKRWDWIWIPYMLTLLLIKKITELLHNWTWWMKRRIGRVTDSLWGQTIQPSKCWAVLTQLYFRMRSIVC